MHGRWSARAWRCHPRKIFMPGRKVRDLRQAPRVAIFNVSGPRVGEGVLPTRALPGVP